MRTLSLMIVFTLLSPPVLAKGYRTSCRIVDEEAQGWVIVSQFDQIEYDGDVTFLFYDEDFDLVKSKTSWDWHWHFSGAKIAKTTRAPSDAVECVFDISAANPVVE